MPGPPDLEKPWPSPTVLCRCLCLLLPGGSPHPPSCQMELKECFVQRLLCLQPLSGRAFLQLGGWVFLLLYQWGSCSRRLSSLCRIW